MVFSEAIAGIFIKREVLAAARMHRVLFLEFLMFYVLLPPEKRFFLVLLKFNE